jgi:2,4'-dihydroxyacetophenone dioxygenase
MSQLSVEDLRKMLPIVPVPSQTALLLQWNDLPFIEIAPGVEVQVLHVDLKQGLWIVRNRFHPGAKINKHYHTGPVFAVTLRGKWFYKEYPHEVNEPGAYLFEPAGAVHTLMVPDDQAGPTEVWFAIHGANVEMDDNDNVVMIVDAATMMNGYRMLCEAQGKSSAGMIVVGA